MRLIPDRAIPPPTTSTLGRMTFAVVRPDELEWITRPHEPGGPSRQVSELSGPDRRSRA